MLSADEVSVINGSLRPALGTNIADGLLSSDSEQLNKCSADFHGRAVKSVANEAGLFYNSDVSWVPGHEIAGCLPTKEASGSAEMGMFGGSAGGHASLKGRRILPGKIRGGRMEKVAAKGNERGKRKDAVPIAQVSGREQEALEVPISTDYNPPRRKEKASTNQTSSGIDMISLFAKYGMKILELKRISFDFLENLDAKITGKLEEFVDSVFKPMFFSESTDGKLKISPREWICEAFSCLEPQKKTKIICGTWSEMVDVLGPRAFYGVAKSVFKEVRDRRGSSPSSKIDAKNEGSMNGWVGSPGGYVMPWHGRTKQI
jgi:hypothetical protein